jgi:HEAT repeat protein
MKTIFAASLAVLLAGVVSLAYASKEDEAKAYTKILKSSKDAKEKIMAATEIGNLGLIRKSYAREAIPYLIEACKDKEPKLRSAAAEALGKVDPPEDAGAVDLLTDMVKNDKETAVRMSAARGLASMGASAKSALPTLREIAKMEDKKSQLGRAAMQAAQAIQGSKK